MGRSREIFQGDQNFAIGNGQGSVELSQAGHIAQISDWDILVREKHAYLIGTALKRGLNPEDAKDAVQDVWLSAWKNRRPDVTTYSANYFTTAMVNKVADIRRSRAVREEIAPTERFVQSHEEIADRQFYDEDSAFINGLKGKIRELEGLDDKQKSILLARLDGQSYEEIANSLGMTQAVARMNNTRGVKVVKKALGYEEVA